MSETETELQCPCCLQLLPNDEFLVHAFEHHPEFFVVLQHFTSPFQALFLQDMDNEYFAMLARANRLAEPEMDEELGESYEELLALCEQMGVVEVGLTEEELEQATTKHKMSRSFCCPICLSDGKELRENGVTEVRKIRACSHAFCKPCLETWLGKNKNCPLCKGAM